MILLSILALVIFFAPTNWFLQLSDQHAYLTGLRVDYLISKLYPVDFLVLFGVVLGGLGGFGGGSGNFDVKKFLNRRNLLLLGLFFALLISQINSELPFLAMTWVLRIVIYCLFAWVLSVKLPKLSKPRVLQMLFWALSLSVIFQSSIGLLQFAEQGSVGGYWFFGETNLNYFANIAKVDIGGREMIAPYGTTAHPNILAGFIAVFLALNLRVFWQKNWRNNLGKLKSTVVKLVFLVSVIIGLTVLALTFSVSGWLTLLSAGVILNLPNAKITKLYRQSAPWLLLGAGALLSSFNQLFPQKTFDSLSISRRIFLAETAQKMWLNNFISGVGLGQFTASLEKFTTDTNYKEAVRFLQPVHHTLWLWLAETGLVGAVLALRFLRPLQISIAITLPALIWDHYWLSQPNALLIFMILPVLASFTTTGTTITAKPAKPAKNQS